MKTEPNVPAFKIDINKEIFGIDHIWIKRNLTRTYYKYKLRAECIHDIMTFYQLISRTCSSFNVKDESFRFVSSLTMEEVIELLELVPDGHVMLRTIKQI